MFYGAVKDHVNAVRLKLSVHKIIKVLHELIYRCCQLLIILYTTVVVWLILPVIGSVDSIFPQEFI